VYQIDAKGDYHMNDMRAQLAIEEYRSSLRSWSEWVSFLPDGTPNLQDYRDTIREEQERVARVLGARWQSSYRAYKEAN
jgi:hypothetical protein